MTQKELYDTHINENKTFVMSTGEVDKTLIQAKLSLPSWTPGSGF